MGLRQWLARTALKFNLIARTPKMEKSRRSIRLSKEDAEQLWTAIENPPEPNEGTIKHYKDYENIFGFSDKTK
jgi:hypothetical protein